MDEVPMANICADTTECCKELSRVWQALGITEMNDKSCSENVAALKAENDVFNNKLRRFKAELKELKLMLDHLGS